MRVGVIALLQESNTFLPSKTELAQFERDVLLTGEAVRERFRGGHHEVSGFFAHLEEAGLDAAPIFAARALPYGVITADAWKSLMSMLLDAVEESGECDGYLVAAHGATASEPELDADGAWLAMLRSHLGPTRPIIGTLDPHANLSKRMVDATNALVAYRTNPHVDQFQTGCTAASLMTDALQGKIQPVQAAAFPPVAINIERQDTSTPPCRPFFDLADAMLDRRGLLSNSVLLGFPYADVPEMGSASLAVTDGDLAVAQSAANELAEHLWDRRHDFEPQLKSIDEALEEAQQAHGRVCLLDMGDNVGGGGPGDSTWLVQAIAKQRRGPAFACLCDPGAVIECEAAGVGGELRLSLGGRSGANHGAPFNEIVRVVGLFDGRFCEPQPRHGGYSEFDQGRSAVVRTAYGLTLLVTSLRMAPFSLSQLRSCGIDPCAFKLLAAKGVVAPMAAYGEVCDHFIRINTPGSTTADVATLPYTRRRIPLFPWERDFAWRSDNAVEERRA